MKEIREIIGFWEARAGRPLAMATLIRATGSSYRRPGARMLIDADGESAGGISAGCIEEEVIACARKVLRTRMPEVMSFDTRLRFGCQGTIEIFVECVAAEVLAALRECALARTECRLITVANGDLAGTRVAAFHEEAGDFTQTIEPALRLIVIGDSSDTGALRVQAGLLGWDVVRLATAPVHPDLLDDRTAVVIATHNYGKDCAALRDLLPRGLRYVGMIGSRRRRDDLLFDVMHDGATPQSELFAPAGLHLEAESPEEIALSIVAEIQSIFAGGTGLQLRHRKMPIHQAAPEAVPCAESAA